MKADPAVESAFVDLRPKLTRLAYRMLGSAADADDILQDTWERWLATDRDQVREPAAFLRTMVTRLCLNELNSARRRRETYVGPWLPEPIIDAADEPLDDFTTPLMMALERLSPLERAAFLLHDVFDIDFEEISRILGRDQAACRKLASRARLHVREARPRFRIDRQYGLQVAAAFYEASRQGDLTALRELLAEQVVVYTDGGGRVAATSRPVTGIDAVSRLFQGLAAYFSTRPSRLVRLEILDGLPGFVTVESGELVQTTALQIEGNKITAVYVTRNPDKLRHITNSLANPAAD